MQEFVVERYHLYAELSLAMRLFKWISPFRELSLWRGSITHEPWPLQAAAVEVVDNTLLAAVGFGAGSTRFAGAHCTPGVGPIDFFWGGFLSAGAATHDASGSDTSGAGE